MKFKNFILILAEPPGRDLEPCYLRQRIPGVLLGQQSETKFSEPNTVVTVPIEPEIRMRDACLFYVYAGYCKFCLQNI